MRIFAPVFCGFAIAGAFVYLLTPTRYTATADLQVSAPAADSSQNVESARAVLIGEVLSDQAVSAAVDRVGATTILGRSEAGLPPAAAVAAVQGALKLSPAQVDRPDRSVEAGGGLYQLSFTGARPEVAAAVVDALVRQATAKRPPRGQGGDTRQQLEVSAGAASAAQTAVTRARDLAALETTSEQLARQSQAALLKQVGAADAEQKAALAAVNAAQVSTEAGATESAELRRLRSARVDLAARQADLAHRYGPLHPQMVAVTQQLHDLDGQIATETRLAQMLSADLAHTRDRLAALRQVLNLSQQLVASYSQQSRQWDQLRQLDLSAEDAHQRYQSAAQAFRRASEPADLSIRAVSPTRVTDGPRMAPASLAVLIDLAVAAGVGFAAALGFRPRRLGLNDAEDVERGLGLRLTASAPEVADVEHAVARAARDPDRAGADRDLVLAYQAVCKRLGLLETSDRPRSVAVCSAVAGEGKTTSALCLARVAAAQALRVVVIDCDGRRQALSRQSAMRTRAGLVEVLHGRATPEEAMAAEGPSGPWLMRHSAEGEIEDLSDSRRLRDLVTSLGEQFDLVVLDTAPILALAESRMVAALAERVLLVARWRETPVGATRAAMDLLDRAGAKLAAFALTRVDLAEAA